MLTGDEITIFPHQRHRVESTSPNTIWLAIFWSGAETGMGASQVVGEEVWAKVEAIKE